MWENVVEWGRLQVTILRMRIACFITKTTDTHSEYIIIFTVVTRTHLDVTLYVLLGL